jgi:hypothetical protein
VPIQLPPFAGLLGMHSLKEGDEILVAGRWKRGQYLLVNRIHNLTTGAIAYRSPNLLLFFLLFLVLGFLCSLPAFGIMGTKMGGFPGVIGGLLSLAITIILYRHEAKQSEILKPKD